MRILKQLYQHLSMAGIPGLFAIALLDSAAIPVAGGPEGLIILLSWRTPAQLPWIILSAAIGSTIGCLILYRIARAGGALAIARMAQEKRSRIIRSIQNQAFRAVFLAVMLPPPIPMKPVIVVAGAVRTPLTVFTAAVFLGRLLRYGILACLGAKFGDRAAEILKEQYPIILIFAALALLGLLLHKLSLKGSR